MLLIIIIFRSYSRAYLTQGTPGPLAWPMSIAHSAKVRPVPTAVPAILLSALTLCNLVGSLVITALSTRLIPPGYDAPCSLPLLGSHMLCHCRISFPTDFLTLGSLLFALLSLRAPNGPDVRPCLQPTRSRISLQYIILALLICSVTAIGPVTSVSCGYAHSCALMATSTRVSCLNECVRHFLAPTWFWLCAT